MTPPLRVVALADTDSYVKWAAALLGAVRDRADVELVIVETPAVVSAAQQEAALVGSDLPPDSVRRMPPAAVPDHLRERAADAVLVASLGPTVRVFARIAAAVEPRPVIVSGLPGISIPATTAALVHRIQCDLFVLHSTQEIRAFTELAAFRGLEHRFGLSRLPFASGPSVAGVNGPADTDRARTVDVDRARTADADPLAGTDLVFAAQAKVPAERADRIAVVRMLADAARATPDRRVVLKLRAQRGEAETHPELHGYRDLLAAEPGLPSNLVVSTVSMSHALDSAQGLVTVSSTAAIEAVARGIPLIVLDTFGISDELINPMFARSGLMGSDADVLERAFRHPDPDWLADNYFHDAALDDWFEQLADLVDARRHGELPAKAPRARVGGVIRDAWERKLAFGRHDRSLLGNAALVVGLPLRAALRAARALRRAV